MNSAKFCLYCGVELPQEAKFCPSCGMRLSSSEPQKDDAESLKSGVKQQSVQAERKQGEHLSATTSQTTTSFGQETISVAESDGGPKPSNAETSSPSPFYRFCKIASHVCFISLIVISIPLIKTLLTAHELDNSQRPPIELLRRSALWGDYVLIIRNMSGTTALKGEVRFKSNRWRQGWLPFLIPANEEKELGVVQLKGYKILADDVGEIKIRGYEPWSVSFFLDSDGSPTYEWLYKGKTIDETIECKVSPVSALSLPLVVILGIMVVLFSVLGRIARVKKKSSAGGQVAETEQRADDESSLSPFERWLLKRRKAAKQCEDGVRPTGVASSDAFKGINSSNERKV